DSPAKAFLPEGVAWQRALLAGSVRGPFERPVLALNGDLAALRLGNPQVEQLLGEAVTLAAEGTLDVPTGTFTLANSALRGAFGEAAAKGTAGARGTDLNVTFATDLERVAPLAGAPLDGDVRALATIRQTPDTPLTIGLGAVVADPRTGQAAADAALGGRLDLVGQVVMQPDGAMVFDQVQIDAAQIDATAEGRFAEGRLDMRTTARLPRLEALPLGTDLAGAVTAEGTLKGPVAALAADLAVRSPRLTVAGRRFDDVDATLALPNIAAPDGRLKADARHQGLPIRAETRFARAETGTRLRDLSLALGRNRASGALMIGDSGLIDGTLTGRFDELGQLAGLAGVELGGSARVEARFTPAAGKQNLRFDVTGGRLAVAGNTVDRLSANGTLRDVLGKPAGRVELTAGGALLGGQRFDRVNARVDGGLDAADFSLTASGDLARIVARGRMAQERGATLVALAEGQVAARGETLRLTQPARIAIGPEGRVAVTDLAARLRDGRLAGTVAVADGIQGRLTLENIPLALAEAFGGPKGLRGRIGGTASFAGDPAAPTADLALRFTGVSAPATQGAGVAGVNGTLDGRWRNGQLSADFRARAQEGGVDLTGQASMPLAAEGGLPAFRTDVPLSGRVRGTVELSRFNNLLAARGDRVGGDVALDIALGGSVAAPNFGGEDFGREPHRADGEAAEVARAAQEADDARRG
ncbi:MAG TPA: hypothetical protein VEH84_17710, partial [Alphaproteobacteria bacterium]|nr:hypothetical protein [Alphaproteobacteria bacterium]